VAQPRGLWYTSKKRIKRASGTARLAINGREAATGTEQRTIPGTFTASETFDVEMDTCSPVADDYFDKAPFEFSGTLKRLHFRNLQERRPAFQRSPDDDE
jgi:hypothetical protein